VESGVLLGTDDLDGRNPYGRGYYGNTGYGYGPGMGMGVGMGGMVSLLTIRGYLHYLGGSASISGQRMAVSSTHGL
jgi:hypothetical protein